jgi:hypothetical protein
MAVSPITVTTAEFWFAKVKWLPRENKFQRWAVLDVAQGLIFILKFVPMVQGPSIRSPFCLNDKMLDSLE